MGILGKIGVRTILPVQTGGPHAEADCTPFSRFELNRTREQGERLRFRKKITLALEMLKELDNLLHEGFQVYVLFDSWYAFNQLLNCR